jgi:hypothetical protein
MVQESSGMFQTACGLSMVQLPITLALISYYADPQFTMYKTYMLNITTQEMEIEMEDFSASILYLAASVCTAVFAAASRSKANLDVDTQYSIEVMQELSMWDMTFWAAQFLQHACVIAFMCSPLDWYFLALVVVGISLLLIFISSLPLVRGGRSKENILMLMFGMLYFMLYTAVHRHGHVTFFLLMLFLDVLMLVGHTFDPDPNMQTVGNCRLCYCAAMSVVLMITYTIGPGGK